MAGRREQSNIGSEAQDRMVEDALGTEVRNEVFVSMYLMQHDVVGTISIIGRRIWRAICASNNRMLNAILPALMERIIADLASWHDQRQATAGATLGDLVDKLGDRVLQSIAPILLDKLTSKDPHARKGVCLGLGAVLSAGSKTALQNYVLDFSAAIREAICDEHKEVRAAAREAFLALYMKVGSKAVRECIPALLQKLTNEHNAFEARQAQRRAARAAAAAGSSSSSSSSAAAAAAAPSASAAVADDEDDRDGATLVLQGLKEIFLIGPCEKEAVDMVVPHFIRPPVSSFAAYCLSVVADSLGKSFERYVASAIESLLGSISALYVDKLAREDEEHEDDDAKGDEGEGDSDEKREQVGHAPLLILLFVLRLRRRRSSRPEQQLAPLGRSQRRSC